jgi:hypothetical protein
VAVWSRVTVVVPIAPAEGAARQSAGLVVAGLGLTILSGSEILFYSGRRKRVDDFATVRRKILEQTNRHEVEDQKAFNER